MLPIVVPTIEGFFAELADGHRARLVFSDPVSKVWSSGGRDLESLREDVTLQVFLSLVCLLSCAFRGIAFVGA
jgi:hypothetical protein